MFLTAAELTELTGKVRFTAQAAWLTRHRWAFELRDDGRPVVARAEAERQLVGRRARPAQPDDEPDFGALRRFG